MANTSEQTDHDEVAAPPRRRKAGPGRKSKGARRPYMTRIPEVDATTLEDEALARGLSFSEYIAVCVAIAQGRRDVTMPPRIYEVQGTLAGTATAAS